MVNDQRRDMLEEVLETGLVDTFCLLFPVFCVDHGSTRAAYLVTLEAPGREELQDLRPLTGETGGKTLMEVPGLEPGSRTKSPVDPKSTPKFWPRQRLTSTPVPISWFLWKKRGWIFTRPFLPILANSFYSVDGQQDDLLTERSEAMWWIILALAALIVLIYLSSVVVLSTVEVIFSPKADGFDFHQELWRRIKANANIFRRPK